MLEIRDNHIFCCNKDLGKIEKGKAYFCEKCSNLFLSRHHAQQTMDYYL